MLRIYCSEYTKLWSEADFKEKMHYLPKEMQATIAKYRSEKERQLRIMGKLLLLKHLNEYESEQKLNLNDIKYNSFNRPFLHADLDFNIAHSENFVVCAACRNAQIGIDIEKIKNDLNINLLKAELTDEELQALEKDNLPQRKFYEFWTRKEAILKALGKGVFTPFNTINSIPDTTSINGIIFYVQNMRNIDGYTIAVASNKEIKESQFIMINY
jgi:4'-phosphopantetheinyl transferase